MHVTGHFIRSCQDALIEDHFNGYMRVTNMLVLTTIIFFSTVPIAGAGADQGDEISNNLFSDLGEI